MTKQIIVASCLLAGALSVASGQTAAMAGKTKADSRAGSTSHKTLLRAEPDGPSQTIKIYRADGKEPILTQSARQDERPYLHPIVAPDGHGVITEYRPSHHPHQTGIFWGFKLLNGREFFMRWQGDHYRRISATVIHAKGQQVKWQTVYDALDESGAPMLTETQNWSMEEVAGKYILDLEWRGEAKIDLTLGKIYVGGLFVRIPWRPGDRAEAVNSVGLRDSDAEQQRAVWMDVGIQVEGRSDLAHIAILDHPDNLGFPSPWRVDTQYGFGANTEWTETKIDKGKERVYRYRIIAYCGDLDPAGMMRAWKEFVKEY